MLFVCLWDKDEADSWVAFRIRRRHVRSGNPQDSASSRATLYLIRKSPTLSSKTLTTRVGQPRITTSLESVRSGEEDIAIDIGGSINGGIVARPNYIEGAIGIEPASHQIARRFLGG